MLFAAGFGTRMRPLTLDRPKPLVEVAGRTLLDHTLDLAKDAELSHVVVNAHYKAEQIEAHLAGTETVVLQEDPDILDTGGGLRNALPILGSDPVLTMNTDAIWQGANPIKCLQNAWDPDRMDALLLLIPEGNARAHATGGDFDINGHGQLSRKGPYVYSGAQVIRTDGLAAIPDLAFSLNVLWDQMIKKERAFGLVYEGDWCDVGAPENLKTAEEMLNV